MQKTGIIFDIKKFALHDGPGIRTTVFLKGCPLRCWWCHNPESHKLEPEKVLHPLTSQSPNCQTSNSIDNTAEEIIGRKVTVKEVIAEIEKDIIFYDQSSGGVTFSGGEPLMQIDFLKELLFECQQREIKTALDTSGYASLKIIQEIVDKVDLFLYDLKIIDSGKHEYYTGVSNQQILDNLKFLSKEEKKVVIRIPIIPTITATNENIKQLGDFISSLTFIPPVELLPFHQIAEKKYQELGLRNKVKDIVPPSKKEMKEIQQQLERFQLQVKIEE
ncbi:MAG: glycyl-radical enzyme activating protein [Candidatus Heimdallarchaeota archaeon]|nr:glycyl-radical enzyme activating protein [Candidatus Heimdallarchaeota archaeon]